MRRDDVWRVYGSAVPRLSSHGHDQDDSEGARGGEQCLAEELIRHVVSLY